MKKKAVKGLVALAVTVCLCMFFSGTIKTLTTAKVKLVTAKQGKLEENIDLQGTLIFPQTQEITVDAIPADTSVVVRRMRVTQGRQVKEGDTLFEAEVSGGEEKLDELRKTYDASQEEMLTLERKNANLRMTRQEQAWIAAYDALGEAKAAVRDARSALEVRAQITGVELSDGQVPEEVEDKALLAAAEALAQAQEHEEAAQALYDSANRLGIRDSVVDYITKSRELKEKMDETEKSMTELSVLMETVKAVTAPYDGFVVEVSAKAGDTLTAKTAVVTMNEEKSRGVLRADVSELSRTVEEGTSVSIERSNGRSVSAKVTDLTINEEGKNCIDVELSDREIANLGGAAKLMRDGIQMTASYRAGSSTTLLPVSAVRGTGDDRYIYVVQETQNALGKNVMTVVRQDVTVLAEVGSTASIEEDIGRQRVAYMEDREIGENSEVMTYAE